VIALPSNFQRTKEWLIACGKEPGVQCLSVQFGCHVEEFIELLDQMRFASAADEAAVASAIPSLKYLSVNLKRGYTHCSVLNRAEALDALCDLEVTGNGVAYLSGLHKEEADQAVLASNDAKLVDGKPLILEGGKIGKPVGWQAPDLTPFI
jgi:hypothetical protein